MAECIVVKKCCVQIILFSILGVWKRYIYIQNRTMDKIKSILDFTCFASIPLNCIHLIFYYIRAAQTPALIYFCLEILSVLQATRHYPSKDEQTFE